MWGRLEETLLQGKPAVGDSIFQEGQGDEVAERLLRGLHRDAVLIAPALGQGAARWPSTPPSSTWAAAREPTP